MDISIVVPFYNEVGSLPHLLEEIDAVMKSQPFSYEVILVDDGSTDGSWKLLLSLMEKYPATRGIRFQRNYGKSAALYTGFHAAEGTVVITMDADLQDNPAEVPELYRMIIEEGYDLVSGWKKKRYDPLSKRLPSRFFNFVVRIVSGIPNLHDFNCGLKSYRNEVVKNIEVYGEMHRYIPMIAKWAGFKKIGEKEVEHRKREYGTSKFGMSRLVTGFLDLVSIVFTHKYMKKPMHFFGTWGVFFVFIGALDLVYLAVIKLMLGEGLGHRIPAMMFGVVTLLLGFMLFSTGLLAELISRNSIYKNQYKIAEKAGGNG
ncbi:MAG: glycosyltransferase family 2 protein [Bacteroidia bacterium]|nr:glycosyltransferase family 2 protein [Bacteroidia bacterium]